MYHHWGVDGHEVNCDDAILSSRPDTLLASGGAFLPSPPLSYTMLPPLPRPPSHSPLTLAPTASSGGMAAAPFRRVLSTGDLLIRDSDEEQRVALQPAPGRYSAEERRERIDKYRSKRNQRNFQKKITYACRKTLADSRPRVKGRFARNAGDYTEADVHDAAAPTYHHHSESEAVPEWWQQEALASATTTEEDELPAGLCGDDDDDMLAAYLGVSSISLYSPASASTTLQPHHHHYSCQP